jgi:prevent-host-death family protein
MKMSVREARANFASALEAAEKGEHVIITKNGKPVAELGPPPKPKVPFSFERAEKVRKKLGLTDIVSDKSTEEWLEWFNDPEWTREIFGPEYYDDEPDRA